MRRIAVLMAFAENDPDAQANVTVFRGDKCAMLCRSRPVRPFRDARVKPLTFTRRYDKP
jgi:hypothetical protein